MRMMMFAALAASVVPAPADRLDTRRIAIRDMPLEHSIPGTICGFAAMPDLWLNHSRDPQYSIAAAVLARAADGLKTSQAELHVSYRKLEGAPFGVSNWAMFRIGQPEGMISASDKTARLSLDGKVIAEAIEVRQDRRGTGYLFNWPSASGYPSRLALPHGKLLTLDLFDAKGTQFATYRWGFEHIDQIPELLSRVQWNCLAPDS